MLSAIRLLQSCMMLTLVTTALAQSPNGPPVVGGQAPDFTLRTAADKVVNLETLTEKGPVVVVLLRGWSGGQDSFDTQQVADFVRKTAEFRSRDARVVLVYPGQAERLKAAAKSFVAAKDLPDNFALVLDPDFVMTQSYGLRWEGPDDTAYPSTFVLGPDRRVAFAKIGRKNSERAEATAVLQVLGISATP